MANHVTIRKAARAKNFVAILSVMEEVTWNVQDYRRLYKQHFGVSLTTFIAQTHIDLGAEQGLVEICEPGNARRHPKYREKRTAPQ